jgi:hypothetical protein
MQRHYVMVSEVLNEGDGDDFLALIKVLKSLLESGSDGRALNGGLTGSARSQRV